jgi:AcrR family transcriptional regulator
MVNLQAMLAKKKLRRELHPDHDKPGSTKERILQVAEELFAEKGFEGTRTRDIAEQVGINISTLHFHWKSKEELYTAVYRQQLARRAKLAEDVFALLAHTPASSDQWQETVQAVVEQMFTFFRVHAHAAQLETHRILDTTAPDPLLEHGPGGTLLMSVAERLRRLLPSELARRLDVELTILTVNAFLREYFTNPAAFGRLLGEGSPEALEKRVKRHVRQMVARLYDLM